MGGDDRSRGPTVDLRPDELELAELLVTGLTDEAVMTRLGLSRRTFQRRLGTLMDGLHARSRFQAGYRFALIEVGSGPDQP